MSFGIEGTMMNDRFQLVEVGIGGLLLVVAVGSSLGPIQ
jgi:hypothetical protein